MRPKSILKILAIGALATGMHSCGSQSLNTAALYQAAATGIQGLTLTNDDIAAYVKQSVDYMDQQNQVAPANSPYTQRLNKLTQGLTSVGNIPLNFKVYVTNDVNAFACADGSVRVYTGIMDMMSDDELLGIIGHEIGHVGMEHSKNAFKQQLLNSALLQAIGSTSQTAAVLTQSQLGQLTDAYLSAKFSRKQENEADVFGYEFLKGTGKNPYAMVEAFEKMQKLEGTGNQNADQYIQKMFSSHPETAERIKNIEERCKKDGFTRPVATTPAKSATNKTTTTKKSAAAKKK